MKMLKVGVKIYIKFDHLLQARNNEKWHDISAYMVLVSNN